jgi:hypothetical protein
LSQATNLTLSVICGGLGNATNLIVTVTVAYLQVFTVSIFGDVAICGTTERSECAPSSASLTV